MRKLRLRTQILCSVGVMIMLVVGTSTGIYIQTLKHDYLEALTGRSEVLAQPFITEVRDMERLGVKKIQDMFPRFSLQCVKLYETYKDKPIAHFAVIDAAGVFGSHNQSDLWGTPVTSQIIKDNLRHQQIITILDGDVYHSLIPIFDEQQTRLATVDIGIPKSVVDAKVRKLLRNALVLFVIFLGAGFALLSGLLYGLIVKPINQLVLLGQEMATGRLITADAASGQSYDIMALYEVFNQVSAYFQSLAAMAAQIATGKLDGQVQIRSAQDILGQAVQAMVSYLRHVAEVATNIANGDLTSRVHVRSATDAFGQAIATMTTGLQRLITQIRRSAEQIAATGQQIADLSARDIEIVQDVQTSAEVMAATMHEMGASVEEVARNMEVLSGSVEMTSASVVQMTSAIASIAKDANELTEQTIRTEDHLQHTMVSLEEVVASIDQSKQLTQATIQEAFRGQQAVEHVNTSIAATHQTIMTAVENITRFEQRSRDIATILDVIREITDQTSLLALNASIIAAQAGVHGRGFAVVADEIKNLASGVSTSTKDIAGIVQTLQRDTLQIVQAIHAGAQDVNLGMERTQQARETLETIITSAQHSSEVVTAVAATLHDLMSESRTVSEAMTRVNLMTNDITSATTEQQASTNLIKQAVERITEMTVQIQRATSEQLYSVRRVLDATGQVTLLIDQNLASSQNITHTTNDLSAQAAVLVQAVDRFKLPESSE